MLWIILIAAFVVLLWEIDRRDEALRDAAKERRRMEYERSGYRPEGGFSMTPAEMREEDRRFREQDAEIEAMWEAEKAPLRD